MRDILVTLIIFGSLPYILKRPYVGVLMWVWVSLMNPHAMGWGFASTFPFAAIIAGTTILSLLVTKDPKAMPWTPVTIVLLAFSLWMTVTTIFSIFPENSFVQWNKVMKIMLMTLVALMLVKTREQIIRFIWVVVLSLGFYGVKGGIFTILTGGEFRVWGPPGSFIQGNNELALALIAIIPLMHYLQSVVDKKWKHHALTASMVICALAALGSHSRGALLAIASMGVFLWLKSSRKGRLGVLLLMTTPVLLFFMPEKWSERMDTIQRYDQDESALGRFNAWWMAWNLAKDNPIVGGGFAIYEQLTFSLYAPDPTQVRAAHSMYFQALGEHGFVGLFLFLLLAILTWRSASWIVRNTARMEDYKWAGHLAAMIQVSLVGYSVGAAFLSLLYFDLPYYLIVALVATRVLVAHELKKRDTPARFGARSVGPPGLGGREALQTARSAE